MVAPPADRYTKTPPVGGRVSCKKNQERAALQLHWKVCSLQRILNPNPRLDNCHNLHSLRYKLLQLFQFGS